MQTAERIPLKLVYEGSVKRVFASASADSQDSLWFEFTDDYSVFDWGKMPDTIDKKGRALTVMGAWFFQTLAPAEFWSALPNELKITAGPVGNSAQTSKLFNSPTFEQLGKTGLPTHFQRLTDYSQTTLNVHQAAVSHESVMMEVAKANVHHPLPTNILGQSIYYYPPVPAPGKGTQCRLIPLEVVFRFGMPAGSSLKQRLAKNPEYAQQLGLSQIPEEGSWFAHPVLEFFTKLEPKDRLLSLTEAMAISTLDAKQFEYLTELARLCAWGLFSIFSKRGIELWDGKFEFIFDGSTGQIKLADSIGPDELRLIYKSVHLSKEIIRQVYRGGDWERSLKKAQDMAAQRQSHDWKSICKDELKSFPMPLPASFKRAVDSIYPSLTNHLAGTELFPEQPSLDELVSLLTSAQPK